MRAHDYDHDASGSLPPKSARLDRPDTRLAAPVAVVGRWDVAGADGLLGLQRSAGNQAVTAALQDEELSPVHAVINSGGGQPLDPGVRADMETRLGHDFGEVRVHHDARAEESAKAVNAHAYTVGSNVVFQRDRYDPSSEQGRVTLAHELTHVVQQRSGLVDGAAAPGGIRLSDPSDRFEREADANAERAMSTPVSASDAARGAGAPGIAAAVQRRENEQEHEESPTAQGAFVQRDEGEEEVVSESVPLQRDDPGTASMTGQAFGTDSGAAQGADASQAPVQMVKVETDEGEQEMPKPQALAYLQDKIEWSSNKIDLMAGENATLKQQRDHSILNSVVGSVADVLGGFLSMPDPSAWDQPKASIAAAKAAISAGDPVTAGNALIEANTSYRKCEADYLTYKDGNLSGADNAITVLKAVILVDTTIGAALTGGATIGAAGALVGGEATATVGASGLLTQAVIAGGVGAEGGAFADLRSQVATGKPWNWAELLEKTGGGFAAGLLGALLSGPLKEMLSESCSGYVSEELMSDADIADIAKSMGVEKLERSFLQSQLKTFVIDKVSEKAGEWLMGKPIDMVTDAIAKSAEGGGAPPDQASAVDTVAEYAAPLIAAAFKASLSSESTGEGATGGGVGK